MIVVGEVAQAHDGSLGTALAYVKAIAAAGADAAKFQDHRFDRCNTFRPGTCFPQDSTRSDYWWRTTFNQEEWKTLRQACIDCGIEYVVSPFSWPALEFQAELSPDRWKIASSKVTDHELIDACVATGKPVILSSGMSDMSELQAAMDRVPHEQLTTLDCTSLYPCPAEMVAYYTFIPSHGMYGVSDHSGTIWPSLVAAAYGLAMSEVHVVFSRECFGPDVSSSITTAELRQLVEGVRFIERLGKSRKERLNVPEQIREVREVFCA